MSAHLIARRLLEADEDFDPQAELSRYSAELPPGVHAEFNQNNWNIYMMSGVNKVTLGNVYYDDMIDPSVKASLSPEKYAHWDANRWHAIAGYTAQNAKECPSFAEAVKFIVSRKQAHVQEAIDPDDPILYTNPDLFSGQPESEKLESSLRVRLRPFYPEVVINRRPADLARMLPNIKDWWTWTVHCMRPVPLRLPACSDPNNCGSPVDWRKEIERWFNQWADVNGLNMYKFKFTGRLRKDPTFQFDTDRGIGPKLNESGEEEDDSPEIIPHLMRNLLWQNDLDSALWEFHPYGVGYNEHSIGKIILVTAWTYFPPDKDNFAVRFKNFVVDWIKKRGIAPVESVKLYAFKQDGPPEYPRWTVGVSLNSTWPDGMPEHVPADVSGQA